MAPLNKAVKLRPSKPSIDGHHFVGEADGEWGIKGWSFTAHVDPIHLTAQFLRKTLPGPVTVRIKRLKTGVAFTNITAELLQQHHQNDVKISTHAIFGLNEANPTDRAQLTLNPPSPWARRHPLYTHPSEAERLPIPKSWSFAKYIGWAEDENIKSKNLPDHPSRTNSSTIGSGGLEWGGWFELKDEPISNPALAFLADIVENTPSLLPKSERPGIASPMWFATLTFSIEFKNKIPSPSAKHADRTVGLYSSGKFVTHPQGRHDIYAEVWTAPSNIGEGNSNNNWRDDQVCLAVATQVALCIPVGNTPKL
ncbi:thioesterase-like superfamily-domain-containing protein [Crepidotus variabilis]|uniref:Thioesterase-like superfamily-domain-containing protein n=1 Tax=Crepidotus variabilis TaxID=179855 RepID=A0A9P6EQZ5_9AGAR|nr:thioesterase-like superfamily-domain-containing protein [Crepidotus variabilis]